jgi:predicted nucleic acid-binding protein
MTLSDANILSTFARVEQIELLRQLVGGDPIYVPPAVYRELQQAVEVGRDFLQPVLDAIVSYEGFDLVALERGEVAALANLPESLGEGEKEAIVVCLHRKSTRLLTNDKRARNYCREQGLACLDLPGLLRALWQQGVCSKSTVRVLIQEIETQEGLVFKDKAEVLKPRRSVRARSRRKKNR